VLNSAEGAYSAPQTRIAVELYTPPPRTLSPLSAFGLDFQPGFWPQCAALRALHPPDSLHFPQMLWGLDKTLPMCKYECYTLAKHRQLAA